MARIPFIDTTHIEDLLSEKKPELAGHTIKSYLSCYRCFCRTENKNLDNYPEWLEDTQSILRYCKKYPSLGSQKTKMTSFVVLAKITNQPHDVIENLQKEMKKMIEEYQKNVELQQFTEKEHQNWLTYDELQELITETLKDMDKNGFYHNIQAREYFKTFRGQLLFLLTCYHPIRNEYGNLKITTDYSEENDDGEHNYLFIKGDKRKKYFIILNKYKTAKKYGRLRIRITEKRVLKPLKYYIDKPVPPQ